MTKLDKKLVCLTAYTAPMAKIFDKHCDILLVGDSLSMVLYGEETTQGATLDMMIAHGRAVAKTAQSAKVIIDLPYGSYESSPAQALEAARRVMDETGAYGVKLEGGLAMRAQIAAITQHGIPVMGHVGLLPQSVTSPDGFKVQGRDEKAAQLLMQDAKAIEAAGAFSVVIEAVPDDLAKRITQETNIPTIGIGAGVNCNGQILVSEDMLGLSGARVPKFVKQYAQLNEEIERAVENYAADVRAGNFPSEMQSYKATNKAA